MRNPYIDKEYRRGLNRFHHMMRREYKRLRREQNRDGWDDPGRWLMIALLPYGVLIVVAVIIAVSGG